MLFSFMLLGEKKILCHPDIWHWESKEEIYCRELLCSVLLKDGFACVFSSLSWLKEL